MIRKPARHLELLAPAGSLEAFFAALDSGADSVYCGLKEFSARAKAKNFTLAEAERLTAHAHRQGKKLYVTLNTLLKEAELPLLIDILADLAAIGVDGIIIQDLGVWRLARTWFPELPLHASTQMTVHNAAGVRMLERMGFVRAVLARELALAEITEIRQQTAIELEHFVHGALCFAISGQCFFSSTISGMSGNRGRCAQPCRRRHLHRDQAGYHFSTSDLCGLDLLPDLIRAGVSSFKIEGRMKSAEYVARVVTAYRLVLDAPAGERKTALREAGEHLALSFGRPATRGFLAGWVPTNIASPSRLGALGRHLGEVLSLRGGMIGLTVQDRLHVGDRLRIQPQNDQAAVGFTVREILVNDRSVRAAKAGDFIRVRNSGKGPVHVGDAVYKVGGKQLFTLSAEACRKRLAETVPAEDRNPTVGDRAAKARATLLAARTEQAAPASFSLTLGGRGLKDLGVPPRQEAQRLQIPLSEDNLAELKKNERRLAGYKERLVWKIPPLLFGPQWTDYRRAVQMLAGQGFRTFRVANLGHLPLFEGLADITLLGDFRCFVLNSQAALAWHELGLAEAAAGLEDDRENLAALLARPLPLPLAVTVYAPLPVLLSRIPLRGIRSGTILRSDKGEGYRILNHLGLTEVIGEEDFSLLGHVQELLTMGCSLFQVELEHCGADSAKGRQILDALKEDRPLPGTTTWNYRRGLV
ncbi:MAG: U32 family peptidase [Desulfobulbaceae bacterium]